MTLTPDAGRCCCPGLMIAWPLIPAWQPVSCERIFKTIFKTTLLMRRRRTISSANSKRPSCFVRPQPLCCCELLGCWRSNLNVVLMNAPQYLACTVIIIVSPYLLNFIFGRLRGFRLDWDWENTTAEQCLDRRNVISNPFGYQNIMNLFNVNRPLSP